MWEFPPWEREGGGGVIGGKDVDKEDPIPRTLVHPQRESGNEVTSLNTGLGNAKCLRTIIESVKKL